LISASLIKPAVIAFVTPVVDGRLNFDDAGEAIRLEQLATTRSAE
jgi:hypothetical protein